LLKTPLKNISKFLFFGLVYLGFEKKRKEKKRKEKKRKEKKRKEKKRKEKRITVWTAFASTSAFCLIFGF
jgi:hypothetical protein